MRQLIIIMAVIFMLSGCAWESIPPAHKGKILTSSGYKPDIIPPSKITTWFRDSLVLIETSTSTFKEPMKVLMLDRLTLEFDVKGRVRIDGSDKVLSAMFDDIIPVYDVVESRDVIKLKMVYNVYGKMLVRNKAREILSKYTIDDVHKSYGEITKLIYIELVESFKGTPLKVSDVALGALKFPAVITKAVEAQKSRELAIAKEKAQVEIELTRKRGEEQLAEADYRIRLLKAKTIRDENKLIAKGISDEYLQYRRLEVMEAMAKNGSTVFMPYESIQSTGASVRMFQGK